MATTLSSQHTGSAVNGERTLRVPVPAAGENVSIDMVQGSEVQLSFNPGEADVSRSGNDLTFQLDDGGAVTISNFFVVEEGGELPMLMLPGGDEVPAALAFADSGLDLSTAAGPGAGAPASGGTSYDDNPGALLLGLDKYGMLGTDYWGRATEQAEEFTGLEMPGGIFGLDVQSDLGAMFGLKGGVYEDGLPWQHQGDRETFVPGQLTFSFTPTGTTVVTGIHLSGFHEGTVIYLGDPTDPNTPVITVTGPDQVIDFTEGDFANGVYLVPPKNSDGDMNIRAEVDVRAESSGLTDTIDGTFTVIVDAVADRPELGSNSAVGDSTGHVASENEREESYDQGINKVESTVSVGENEGGATVTVTVSATFDDYEDGSEAHYLLVQTHGNLAINPDALPDGYTYLGTIVVDGVEYHQIAVDNDVIADGGGTVSLPVVFETTGDDAGEQKGEDQQFDLKVGAYAEEDVDPAGEIDLGNNTAHIVTEDGKGVTAVVDVVNGTLDVSAGWAYEGNDGSKHVSGGYKPTEDDFKNMDEGDGVSEDSTGANGAPISIGLAEGSHEGSAEYITSAELAFSEGRGELLVGGEPVHDGMTVDGANGVTYAFAVDSETGAVTITVTGGHVSNLDELDMSFRPSQTGENRFNDEDVEFSYKVTVENEAGAKGQFEGKTEIVIDAVADKPVGVGGAGVNYGDGKTAAVPGQEDVEISFKATFPDTSGSEEHTIFIRVDGNNGSATHGYGDHVIGGDRISEVNGIAGSNVLNSNGDYLELTIPPLDQFTDGSYTYPDLGITITYNGNGSYTVSGVKVTMPDEATLTDGKTGNGELNADTGDTSMNFGTVAWAHEPGGEKGSNAANNEHDAKNNDAFTSGNAKVDIATVGGDKDDFTVGGGAGFETDMPHNNVPQNPDDPAGSASNSNTDGGTDLSVTWDFSDSKEYVSEIILTVPTDRWGNPVGDIVYKGEVVAPGPDGKVHIPVDSADGKSGIKDGDLSFVPKGHDSGKVEIDVEAVITDPRSGDTQTSNAGTIEVDVDAVANRSGEVSGEAVYGDGLEAVATGDLVTIKVGTTFDDNDGSERHFILVEQKPHWEGDYDVEYYDLDGDGVKEPYFKVPVPSAPPEGSGDDYAGDAHHLSAVDWATLCETGTVTTQDGVTITIPKGADGKPDPSGEWRVEAEVELDPPALAEGGYEIGTGSLVEEHDVNHSTENRGDEYKDNNIAMRPGETIGVEVNNTEGIKVEGEFLYEAGEQYRDKDGNIPEGHEQKGLIHVGPSSGDDSFFGDLSISIPAGHGVLYYEGQELKAGETYDDVTLYDKNGDPVTGSLHVEEKGGQLTVTFKPDDPEADYKGIDLEVRLPGTDYSDKDIDVSVKGNLQNDKSGQQSQGVKGEGEVMVDAVAQAPDDVTGSKEQDADLTPGGGNSAQVTLTATFDDNDNSEEHFFLLEAKPGLSYTFTVNGKEETIDVTGDWPTVVGPDGTVYFKIPAEHGKDGKASLDVTVKATDDYIGGSKSDIKYGSMAEDRPSDDGEKTYDNNIDFSDEGSLTIDVETGGGGPVSVDIAYENNTPDAHVGDDAPQYAKITLPSDADEIRLQPGEGCGIMIKEGDTYKELEADENGWVTIPKGSEGNVYFKAPDGYGDEDQKLGYDITGGPNAGKGSVDVHVDAVAQQGSVDGAVAQTENGYTAVGEGPVTVTVELSGLVDQDGSSSYYVLIQAKPGWECPDGELVLIDGTAYFRVPVDADDIDEYGNVSVDVTLKTPPAGADGKIDEELKVGSMVVDTPSDGEHTMGNNVSVNVNGKVEISKSVAEATLVLGVTEGYEDNLDGTAAITVSGVGADDVVTEMHFGVDPAEGAFTFNGEVIGEDGYSDEHVTITVSEVDGKTVISIKPTPPSTGFTEEDLKDYVNGNLGLATADGNHSSDDIVIEWGYTVKDTQSGHETGKDNVEQKVVIDAVAHEPELVDYSVDYGDGRQAAEPGDTVTVKGTVEFTNINDETNYVLVQFAPGWEVDGITVTVGDQTIHYTADEVRAMDMFYPDGSGGGGAYYKVPLEKGDTKLEPGVGEGGKYQVEVEVETKVPESGISKDTQGQLGIGGAAVDSYGDGETSLSNNVASDKGFGDGIHIGIVDSTGISAEASGDTSEEGVASIDIVITPVGGDNDVITGLTLTNPDPDSGFFYYDGEKLAYDENGRAVLPPAGLSEEELKNWRFDSDKLEFRPDEYFGGSVNVKVEATVADGKSGASKDGFETGLEIEVTPVATQPTGLEASSSFDDEGGLWTLTLSAVFADADGSEEHFFLVKIPDGLRLEGEYPGMEPALGPNGEEGYWRIPVDPEDANPSLDLHFSADSTWDGTGEVEYHAGASENGTTEYADAPDSGNASSPGDGFAFATEHVAGEADFSSGSDPVTEGMLILGSGGNDTITGGLGNDTIMGGDGNDILVGGLGNDVIYGDSGNNVIIGGQGDDTLYGGTGEDTFFWDVSHFGQEGPAVDVVHGFEFGKDVLQFNDVFGDDLDLSSVEGILSYLDEGRGSFEDGVLSLNGDSCTISAGFGENGVSLDINTGDSCQTIEVNFSEAGYQTPLTVDDAAEILKNLISQGAL